MAVGGGGGGGGLDRCDRSLRPRRCVEGKSGVTFHLDPRSLWICVGYPLLE